MLAASGRSAFDIRHSGGRPWPNPHNGSPSYLDHRVTPLSIEDPREIQPGNAGWVTASSAGILAGIALTVGILAYSRELGLEFDPTVARMTHFVGQASLMALVGTVAGSNREVQKAPKMRRIFLMLSVAGLGAALHFQGLESVATKRWSAFIGAILATETHILFHGSSSPQEQPSRVRRTLFSDKFCALLLNGGAATVLLYALPSATAADVLTTKMLQAFGHLGLLAMGSAIYRRGRSCEMTEFDRHLLRSLGILTGLGAVLSLQQFGATDPMTSVATLGTGLVLMPELHYWVKPKAGEDETPPAWKQLLRKGVHMFESSVPVRLARLARKLEERTIQAGVSALLASVTGVDAVQLWVDLKGISYVESKWL